MQKKRIIIVVIAGLLIIAAAFTLINLKDIREKGVGGFVRELFNPYQQMTLVSTVIDSENQGALEYGIHKDYIIYAGKQGVCAIDLNGDWLWDETSVSFLKPYIKSSGEYIIVAELDGNHILLFKGNILIWKADLSGEIISADINKHGYVAVTHKLENYNAAVTVMKPSVKDDNTPEVLFINKINSESIITAILSDNSGQMMLSGISTEEEKITGSLSFINMDNGKNYSTVKIDGGIYPIAWYIDDETVIAANSMSLKKIRKSKSSNTDNDIDLEFWGNNKNSGHIYAAGIAGMKHIICASGNDSQGVYSDNGNIQSKISILDLSGKELKSFIVPENVKRIDTGSSLFAVSSEKHTTFYDTEGEKLYEFDTVSEIRKVLIINKNNYVVVTSKNIYILKAKPI